MLWQFLPFPNQYGIHSLGLEGSLSRLDHQKKSWFPALNVTLLTCLPDALTLISLATLFSEHVFRLVWSCLSSRLTLSSVHRMLKWAGTVSFVWIALPQLTAFLIIYVPAHSLSPPKRFSWLFYLNNPSLSSQSVLSYSLPFSFKAHIKIRNSVFIACYWLWLSPFSRFLSSVREKQARFYHAIPEPR